MSPQPLLNSGAIAIIGMSCRVAGAESPSELWDLLATSKDVQKEIARFNSAGYYKATGAARKGLTNVRQAYLLDGGIDRFDNSFFAVPATEAIAMDPQQRLLLEVSYEAVENAGISLEDFRGTDTAVYAGKHNFVLMSLPLRGHHFETRDTYLLLAAILIAASFNDRGQVDANRPMFLRAGR